MKTIISYNDHDFKKNGDLFDLEDGYNVLIDFTDPTKEEVSDIQNKLNIDSNLFLTYFNKSLKPEVRVFDEFIFVVLLDIKNKDSKTLETEGIYMIIGKQWLIIVHSHQINIVEIIERLFKIKNKKIREESIDVLFYNLLVEIISKYEQLLTSIELSVNEYQRQSFDAPTQVIFENITILSKHTIILRRYFWRVRNVINFLIHNERDKEDIQYIEMVYDEITQLIEFVESFESTINLIRELYIASVSLQINETMRLLTIFTAILLPLGLISGIYGMNGLDLNKLGSVPMGFWLVVLTMIFISLALVSFFVRKKWLLVKKV